VVTIIIINTIIMVLDGISIRKATGITAWRWKHRSWAPMRRLLLVQARGVPIADAEASGAGADMRMVMMIMTIWSFR
jgi:hypothetical protein